MSPALAARPHIELYLRWMQEVRRYKPSTVSRRISVVAGFYRTCVIDGVLEHSPAEYVRRPRVPSRVADAGSDPSAVRGHAHRRRDVDQPHTTSPWSRCSDSSGCGSSRPPAATSRTWARSTATASCACTARAARSSLVPLPPAVARAIDRAVGDRHPGPILLNRDGTRMDRHVATRRLDASPTTPASDLPRMHPHMLRHTFVTTMLDAGVDLRDVQIAARHADPRTTMRYDRARKNLDRHPNYILAAYMASGT